MKKITGLLIGSALIFNVSTGFAADKTDISKNWICTTNASSSSVEADQQADDKMKNTALSIADAFSFAAAHCRDCTKVTCESNS